MAWFLLIVAGLLEVVWALGLKFTEGFTRPLPTVITVLALVGSFVLLAQAARTLPIGTAYAVWVGIGAVGAVLGGAVLFDEALTPIRVGLLIVLVATIAALKLTSPTPSTQPSTNSAQTTGTSGSS